MTELDQKAFGAFMRREIKEARAAFARAAQGDHSAEFTQIDRPKAIYTLARGSSDAAALTLSYSAMQALGIPVTSLPPSVFSLYNGIAMQDTMGLMISQSGGSEDLQHAVRGVQRSGGKVIALLNKPNSPVGELADHIIPLEAGAEEAVPATKSVLASLGAGLALVAAWAPERRETILASAEMMLGPLPEKHPLAPRLEEGLLSSDHIFIVGRGAGYGAAQEIALKIKETTARHAEAYSAAEVLHGPMQMATRGLMVVILDTGEPEARPSLDLAEERLRAAGGAICRLTPGDIGVTFSEPVAAAGCLLSLLYASICDATIAMHIDPDRPSLLSKVTQSR